MVQAEAKVLARINKMLYELQRYEAQPAKPQLGPFWNHFPGIRLVVDKLKYKLGTQLHYAWWFASNVIDDTKTRGSYSCTRITEAWVIECIKEAAT